MRVLPIMISDMSCPSMLVVIKFRNISEPSSRASSLELREIDWSKFSLNRKHGLKSFRFDNNFARFLTKGHEETWTKRCLIRFSSDKMQYTYAPTTVSCLAVA